jgi:orotate phosphoribosyltransferase
MDDRQALFEIIRTRAFRQGGAFRLASGRMSTIYFNLKPVMLDAEGARLIGRALAREAARLDADLVGGLEMGAVPLVAAAAAMSGEAGRPVSAVFVRKAAKAHGTQSLIEGLTEGESLAGRRVLVVEDVTTTGGSALQAVEALRGAGAQVRDVATLVDREEGAEAALAGHGLALHALYRKSEFAAEA